MNHQFVELHFMMELEKKKNLLNLKLKSQKFMNGNQRVDLTMIYNLAIKKALFLKDSNLLLKNLMKNVQTLKKSLSFLLTKS